MPDEPPAAVLAAFGADRREVTGLSDVPDGNANWLISGDSGHLVLRRHHAEATVDDLVWEHAVLRHLAAAAWTVPEPVGELTGYQGHWYGLTRYVPAAGPVYRAVRVGLAAWADGAGAPHRAVRPGRDRAPAGPLRDPAALNRLYGVRLAAARRRRSPLSSGARRLGSSPLPVDQRYWP
ncbi:MAG TPA: phosphotransferase [Streptosporangiaceae bacterium]|nr:phosphotransferase [Streptosporangiaceae bacterium]